MARIRVHLLNYHVVLFTHIEILLEDTSCEPHRYYQVNRWSRPASHWSTNRNAVLGSPPSSEFAFDIEADPHDIVRQWTAHHAKVEANPGGIDNNCATAAQWFLTSFADIPSPSRFHVSWNQSLLFIMWPSFLSCPATLPGRVMDSAKFHVANTRLAPDDINAVLEEKEPDVNPYLAAAVHQVNNLQNRTIRSIALRKLQTLKPFYDGLVQLDAQAVDLQQRGYDERSCSHYELLEFLQKAARQYLDNWDHLAHYPFQLDCLHHMRFIIPPSPNGPRLLANGMLMLLAIAITCITSCWIHPTLATLITATLCIITSCVHKTRTGHFFCFGRTHATDTIREALSHHCEVQEAVRSRQLP